MDNLPTVQTRFQRFQTGLQWLLARPYIWCPVLAIALLGIFLWENRDNPDWISAYQGAETTASGLNLSNLTPEQQAQLAATEDPDQLSALVGEFSLMQSEEDQLAQQEALDAEAGQDEFGIADDQAVENPFAEYLESYSFMGSSSGSSPNGGSSTGPEFFLSSPRSGRETTPASATSALQDALTRQSEARQAESQANRQPSDQANDPSRTRQEDGPPGTTGPARNGSRTGSAANRANGGQGNGNSGNGTNANGAVPGLPPFMRTMPNMSPPPGGTGYTAPPVSAPPIQTLPNGFNNSFNNGVPQAGQGSAGTVPTAPSSNFSPGFSSQPPRGAGTVLPPTNSFQSPNGFNAQPLPNPNTTTTIPRPPGSNIGGGYINTFSNPSAPPPQ